MKLSHNELEKCAENPSNWFKVKIQNQGTSFIRTGYAGFTKLAILKFHKTNNEIEAQKALSKYLSKFKDIVRIDECENNLFSYINWFKKNNPVVIATKSRINIDINFGNFLIGEITRVDLHSTGYAGILLGNKSENWSTELRMPLLQLGLSQLFSRDIMDFSIGVQNLDGSGLEIIKFDKLKIQNALKKAKTISKELFETKV